MTEVKICNDCEKIYNDCGKKIYRCGVCGEKVCGCNGQQCKCGFTCNECDSYECEELQVRVTGFGMFCPDCTVYLARKNDLLKGEIRKLENITSKKRKRSDWELEIRALTNDELDEYDNVIQQERKRRKLK